MERELHFAKHVQAALLPMQLPKRVKGVDLAASFAAARELGGDFHDFLVPDSSSVIVAVGDVSGKGVPAALYSVFASELVRGRAMRRRFQSERAAPATVLMSINSILHERQLEEYYCTLCYAFFDLKRRAVTMANSGLPYPVRASGDTVESIVLPGVPLGSFFGVTYDEVRLPLVTGDCFVFCSDGVFEAMNSTGEEFTAARLRDVVGATRGATAAEIVTAIEQAVEAHRAGFPPNDDTTIVVLRVTA
jgi:sigma-B regulation protein RsbU (phosphoserine phosphatase)